MLQIKLTIYTKKLKQINIENILNTTENKNTEKFKNSNKPHDMILILCSEKSKLKIPKTEITEYRNIDFEISQLLNQIN